MNDKAKKPTTHNVIIENDFENYTVYMGTIENAVKLLKEKYSSLKELGCCPTIDLLDEIQKKDSDKILVRDYIVVRAIKDIAGLKNGSESKNLFSLLNYCPEKGVQRGSAKVTKAYRDELIVWMFNNNLNLQNLFPYELSEKNLEDLSFMGAVKKYANGREIEYVASNLFEEALTLNRLLNVKFWELSKEDEDKLLPRYIELLNSLDGDNGNNQENYVLGNMELETP